MKAADVDQARHELQRLRELESAFADFARNGRFEINALRGRHDYSDKPVEFMNFSVSGCGVFTSAYNLAQLQDLVRAAYQQEIDQTRARLEAFGVEIGKVKEAKAA